MVLLASVLRVRVRTGARGCSAPMSCSGSGLAQFGVRIRGPSLSHGPYYNCKLKVVPPISSADCFRLSLRKIFSFTLTRKNTDPKIRSFPQKISFGTSPPGFPLFLPGKSIPTRRFLPENCFQRAVEGAGTEKRDKRWSYVGVGVEKRDKKGSYVGVGVGNRLKGGIPPVSELKNWFMEAKSMDGGSKLPDDRKNTG